MEEDVSRETSSFYSYLEIVKERKMEIIKIVRRERNLLEILMIIWEDSVRHTHDFLRESDIKALRPLVYQNLESIPELWAIKAEDSCYKGFMGIDGIKLEMLFVASSERGQGFGSKLLLLCCQRAWSDGSRR